MELKFGRDQAASLRPGSGVPAADAARREKRPSLLAVASGKGGVGKTFLSVNIALALRDLGQRCLIMDLDWGLANVDVALGVVPRHHVGHVMSGQCSLEDALMEYEGLAILPNGCGQADLADLDDAQRTGLMDEVMTTRLDRDVVVADTHPGIGPFPVDVLRRAKVTIVVSTPEPTALTDTYALFKVLNESERQGPAGLVINQAESGEQAHEVARHLDTVAKRFIGSGIAYWGYILQDAAVPRSVRHQRAVLASAPRSLAARAVRQIAATVSALMEAEGRSPSAGTGQRSMSGRA